MKRLVPVAGAAALALASPALAQEAIFTPSATQPSQGVFTLRAQTGLSMLSRTEDGRDIDKTESRTDFMLSYGLSPDLAVTASLPLIVTDEDGPADLADDAAGVGDLALTFKYRFFQRDDSPIDTWRAALLFGAELPTFDANFSSDSVDPMVGIVTTIIRGRHGLNLAGRYQLNTDGSKVRYAGSGPDDVIRADVAYLFRLDPAAYTATTAAATYLTVELNTVYETGGDREIVLAPGLLYEARQYALEIGLRLPVEQEVRDRAELDWGVSAGFRLLF